MQAFNNRSFHTTWSYQMISHLQTLISVKISSHLHCFSSIFYPPSSSHFSQLLLLPPLFSSTLQFPSPASLLLFFSYHCLCFFLTCIILFFQRVIPSLFLCPLAAVSLRKQWLCWLAQWSASLSFLHKPSHSHSLNSVNMHVHIW